MPHAEMTAPISVPDDGRLRPQDNVPHEDWVADVDRAGGLGRVGRGRGCAIPA